LHPSGYRLSWCVRTQLLSVLGAVARLPQLTTSLLGGLIFLSAVLCRDGPRLLRYRTPFPVLATGSCGMSNGSKSSRLSPGL